MRIETVTFDELSKELCEYESKHGVSCVGLFAQYMQGTLDHGEGHDDLIGVFMLYLGTSEICKFVHPRLEG